MGGGGNCVYTKKQERNLYMWISLLFYSFPCSLKTTYMIVINGR